MPGILYTMLDMTSTWHQAWNQIWHQTAHWTWYYMWHQKWQKTWQQKWQQTWHQTNASNFAQVPTFFVQILKLTTLALFWAIQTIHARDKLCHSHCFNFKCFRLHYFPYILFEAVFLIRKWGKKNEVVFHFQNKLRSSSNSNKIEFVFHFQTKFILFSIFKNIQVIFHLHTENQFPRLSRTALIIIAMWWWGGFLTAHNTTSTEVGLSCFGLLLGCGNTLHFCLLSNVKECCRFDLYEHNKTSNRNYIIHIMET